MTREERSELIAMYAAGYDEVLRALAELGEDRLTVRSSAGGWSAAEIVHHLADSEMTSAVRIRRLLAEDDPVIQGYDQDRFAERLRYNELPLGPALEAFRAARAVTVQLLHVMTDEEWQRAGSHSESGRYSAEGWLRIYAAHAHQHAEQIKRLAAQ